MTDRLRKEDKSVKGMHRIKIQKIQKRQKRQKRQKDIKTKRQKDKKTKTNDQSGGVYLFRTMSSILIVSLHQHQHIYNEY